MSRGFAADSGSFRDPANRVYVSQSESAAHPTRILRGLGETALANYECLSGEAFYNRLHAEQRIVATELLQDSEVGLASLLSDGWKGVLEHQAVPFVSYPYEWTFTMLKDAALLQLHILEQCLENGWTLKDATPYNIQFVGSHPLFIDIPSFEPWEEGDPWVGYRQFCSMFLIPLMVRAHLGIDHLRLLRSYIDGVPPTEAIKFFRGLRSLKTGVLSHVILPAKIEASIAKRERDDAPARNRTGRKQTRAMVIGLVQSIARLIRKLRSEVGHTDWSMYDKTHSYQDADFEAKRAFVNRHAGSKHRDQIWDIGCNTGTFSRICCQYCNQLIAVDGDHDAVEQLYLEQREKENSNILPMVMDMANISPGQGWAGKERQPFDHRKRPDLILCLALIHHIRLSANIPNAMFLEWLRSLNAEVILEFVNREDEMVVKLLTNKKEQYSDYNTGQFISELKKYFTIRDRKLIKNGKRELFFLEPS